MFIDINDIWDCETQEFNPNDKGLEILENELVKKFFNRTKYQDDIKEKKNFNDTFLKINSWYDDFGNILWILKSEDSNNWSVDIYNYEYKRDGKDLLYKGEKVDRPFLMFYDNGKNINQNINEEELFECYKKIINSESQGFNVLVRRLCKFLMQDIIFRKYDDRVYCMNLGIKNCLEHKENYSQHTNNPRDCFDEMKSLINFGIMQGFIDLMGDEKSYKDILYNSKKIKVEF